MNVSVDYRQDIRWREIGDYVAYSDGESVDLRLSMGIDAKRESSCYVLGLVKIWKSKHKLNDELTVFSQ